MKAVVRGVTMVSSFRHRGWDPTTALHVARPSRARKSRFATGIRCGICILRPATDLQAVNGAEDATSEPTLGATLCAVPCSHLLWQRPMPARDLSHVPMLVANAPPASSLDQEPSLFSLLSETPSLPSLTQMCSYALRGLPLRGLPHQVSLRSRDVGHWVENDC